MSSVGSQSTTPIHILDLPNEILAHIFTHVRGPPYDKRPLPLGCIYFWDGGLPAIKSTRLVCRKFHDESSHLLIPAISVSMNSSSLALLDQVSRHPLIAKGVRTVRVILDFFAPELANEFNPLFAQYQHEQLHATAALTRSLVEDPNFQGAGDADLEAVDKCRKILDSWEKGFQGVPDDILDDLDRENISVLRRGHELYRRAYLEQEQMRTDGRFVQVVADAIARMPVARFLLIADHDRSIEPRGVPFCTSMESPSLLVENMVQPMTWDHAAEYVFVPPPVELLSQIPLAIHKAGVALEDINYQIAPIYNFSRLFGSDRDLEDLKIAMRQLKGFTFRPAIGRDHVILQDEDEDEVRHLKSFVGAFTDTDSLRDIYIDMTLLWPRGEVPLFSAGGLLLTRTWPQLRRMAFEGPLHLKELRRFYAKSQGPVPLKLEEVYLMSGSWADVLDVMRAHSDRREWSYVKDPHGAECDDLSEAKKRSVFGDYFNSAANLYIRRSLTRNPLR